MPDLIVHFTGARHGVRDLGAQEVAVPMAQPVNRYFHGRLWKTLARWL